MRAGHARAAANRPASSPPRVKIAQVMAGAPEGGAELFFERLCVALAEDGADVLPIIRRDARRARVLRAAGLTPVELAFGPPLDLLTRPRLRRALARAQADVAVYWMSRANQHRPRGPWISVGRLGGYYDLRHYRGCDHLVGNTRGIVAWLRAQGWAEARTHYVPNFVDDFGDGPAVDRAALGVPDDHRMLLALGRLHTDKGFDTLIRALAAIPAATLAIAGSGPEAAALAALAAREGVAERVRFLGWRRDAGALLRAADLFVCASRVEPLGNMVIEAWSARCPLVAAAAAGPVELIDPGRDGVVVPLEDPRAMGAAIAALLDDPARRAAMVAAGRARFERDFSRAPVVAQWRDFLARLPGATSWRDVLARVAAPAPRG